ncbi:hypothetical protein TSUD_151960 [Trifolium subterraneum]|uniref:Uncharacterized protein n=1 Tax=Trifolium subterraneum TaxID=3900 RepID=A0A2Z6N8B3_TRISU|nr:hypothetical protein TSUD_151960 [Trifolium subterraneum]
MLILGLSHKNLKHIRDIKKGLRERGVGSVNLGFNSEVLAGSGEKSRHLGFDGDGDMNERRRIE